MSEAVIALGTNMGNRIENINAAVRAIARLSGVKILKASAIYETEPVGCEEDDKYYNAALLVETSVSPAVLLGECLGIESGECTSDLKFSVEACRCIGACGLAPVFTINDDVYGRVTPDEIPDILAKYN